MDSFPQPHTDGYKDKNLQNIKCPFQSPQANDKNAKSCRCRGKWTQPAGCREVRSPGPRRGPTTSRVGPLMTCLLASVVSLENSRNDPCLHVSSEAGIFTIFNKK